VKKQEIRVCIMRVGGTNCDVETHRAFKELGVSSETVHLNELVKNKRLMDYHALVLPGGFSYGDYIRAGVVWAKLLSAKLAKPLEAFVEDGRLVLGICNGFQVLVELGLLPAFKPRSEHPEAALAPNTPQGYNCRWVHLRHENRGKCVFTRRIQPGQVLRVPIAHSEGRFIFPKEAEQKLLRRLYDEDMLVLRYCHKNGEPAGGIFPANPNGAFHDIAGICNPEGTVFGLMPHPERAFYWWQQPDWTRQKAMPQYGDGKLLFEGMVEYLAQKF